MENGVLLVKINGKIVYFNIEEIEKMEEGIKSGQDKNSDLQQKVTTTRGE
ncbi:hypothetical protein [Clostridium brassicae]|uniref:Uncharacterized protein n=1 Tax=Clostridium brassicae TaxID=2999072 RepID=A0ABT4D691_9CLOT|nr:hypothetical protein [Clostridium brassicae]MCY6957819.1 hypothetical protein [Clostridium brassicae]